jgi:DNA polymerase-1
MNLYGLDLETDADEVPEYKLQPWRTGKGAWVTLVGLSRDKGERALRLADPDPNIVRAHRFALTGHLRHDTTDGIICGANVIFDVAWLIASGFAPVARMNHWLDILLLWKWLDPNRFEYNLIAACREFLAGTPWIEDYIALKLKEKEEGFRTENTPTYVQLDAKVCPMIAREIIVQLTEQQLKSAMIEQQMIYPLARAWVTGVPLNLNAAQALQEPLEREKQAVADSIPLAQTVLGSPVQLGPVLWDQWLWPEGLKKWARDPKTKTYTDKSILTYATDVDDRAVKILNWRKANTRLSKYVESPIASCRYNDETWTHPSPKVYATYTGRMTYASKIDRKKAHPIGVALHQWCREKEYRAIIEAPPGFHIVECDAAGQEMRFMGEQSQDPTMLQLFKDGKDPHSVTGAEIGGIQYETFMQRKAEEDESIVGPRGFRYLGKIANLSLQYRTSPKSLKRVARVEYGVDASIEETKHWHATYFKLYPGVRSYWERAITKARELGYVETLGGRRIYIPRWKFTHKEWSWSAESTSLNFPVQGTGADQKELAIATLNRELNPEKWLFMFDLHDGLFFLVREDLPDSEIIAAKQILDTLDYTRAWGWTPSIALPWDVERGRNWGSMKEVK